MRQRTHLFLAITRQSERGGLPFGYNIIVLTGPLLIFIMTQGVLGIWAYLLAIAIAIPLWFAAKLTAIKDPYLPDVITAKVDCNLFTPNRALWGGNSYSTE